MIATLCDELEAITEDFAPNLIWNVDESGCND
jgi:hypothetical protein